MFNTSVNEDELLVLIKAGDNSAFKLLYDLYWESLFISAYNLLKNREACEDILQEIFIKFWTNRDKIIIKTTLKGYLHASVVYKVYDYFKKNKNVFIEEFVGTSDRRAQIVNPESQLIFLELVAQVEFAIQLVPEKSRIVYKLSRDKQLSHKEIADQLNISIKTVEAHITKSLKIIRSSLNNVHGLDLVLLLSFIDIFST